MDAPCSTAALPPAVSNAPSDETERRLIRQNAALVALAREPDYFGGDLTAALRKIAKTACDTLDVGRASVWLYRESRSLIECVELFEADDARHSAGAVLSAAEYPAYFDALHLEEIIAAEDAHQDPRTAQLGYAYLAPHGIGAMLDAPVRRLGGTRGVVCFEHLGSPRLWTADERSFARAVSDLVACVLEMAERREAEARAHEAERHALEILESITDGFFALDREWNLTFMNRAAEGYLVRSRSEMLGQNIWDLFPEALGLKFETECTRTLREGEPVQFVEYLPTLGLWLDTRAFPSRNGITVYFRDVTSARMAALELQERDIRHQLLGRATQDLIYDWDMRSDTIQWGEAGLSKYGYREPTTSLDWWEERVHPSDRDRVVRHLQTVLAGEEDHWSDEYRFRLADGSYAAILERGYLVRNPEGAALRMIGAMTDISRQKETEEKLRRAAELERQLRDASKMEAIGQLAGGVAHDFNNMLAVINGYASLLLERPHSDPLQQTALQEILRAGERSADLTRQLLAFSRRQLLEPKRLDLGEVVTEMEPMLRRLIGEDIQVITHRPASVGSVHVDPCQMQQVLLNLAVNARDAMPDGGTLTITLQDTVIRAGEAGLPADASPGAYVLLTVEDTGCGMSPEVAEHVFEPFFTTKPVGEGTGLGLATIYGIVRQSQGYITVSSRQGEGSRFNIYLPSLEPLASAVTERSQQAKTAGQETVLLVEDEPMVRKLLEGVLSEQGYRVFTAADGAQALEISETHAGAIDLLLTDVVMPGPLNGGALAQEISRGRPEVRVLFMSGYTDDAVVRRGVATETTEFLYKPFSPATLLQRVRSLLDYAAL